MAELKPPAVCRQIPRVLKRRELERLLGLRELGYPHLVDAGCLTRQEAEARIQVLRAIFEDYVA